MDDGNFLIADAFDTKVLRMQVDTYIALLVKNAFGRIPAGHSALSLLAVRDGTASAQFGCE